MAEATGTRVLVRLAQAGCVVIGLTMWLIDGPWAVLGGAAMFAAAFGLMVWRKSRL